MTKILEQLSSLFRIRDPSLVNFKFPQTFWNLNELRHHKTLVSPLLENTGLANTASSLTVKTGKNNRKRKIC